MRVDPEVLTKAGVVCGDLRDGLRRSAADVDDETLAAVAGLPGWRTRAALEQVAVSWQDDLRKLMGYLSTLSEAFNECARDYRYSDSTAAARFDIRGR
ncbi:hypothetical protein GCM10011608_29100 [Micromonospora sonchi]|uniref:Excreted virulence factor EspC, type VII ESX diderm n=1 Tax=Micromonospora sonchi TaxID=1763543 RepID=A0A917TXI9_9ACTN|nr:hypothetical protein [Micromonospora sonchi]GGM42611.1 hypothetical protein GCM10011608_29100 [Micromonospora sonchi]